MNFEQTIERIKEIDRLANDYEVAELFSMAPSDFNRRKKKGLLSKQIIEWGINRGVNLNWLWTGIGYRLISDENTELSRIRADFNAMNERLVEFEKSAASPRKIRKDDPPEKKDDIIKMRNGVVRVEFNRKNNGS